MAGLVDLLRYVLSHPMNRSDRLAALRRVVSWQVGSRLLPAGSAVPFVDDTVLFMTRGMTGATGNWYCGLHEVDEMAFLLHTIRPGERFFDVGANVGSYAILAASKGADVVAAEPVLSTCKALTRNVQVNDFSDRIRVENAAVGESVGELRMTSELDTTNHAVAAGDDQGLGVLVPMTTLDELAKFGQPNFLKVDVEGYEAAVVRGGQTTLSDRNLHAVVMETNGSGRRYGEDDIDLVRHMLDFGFVTCTYDGLTRRLSPADPSASNTIFVRDVAAMQARVSTAPRHRLVNGTI